MYFLSISFTLFLLLLMSTGSPSSVRYCDRIFQLLNRTDESEKTCKWYSPQIVEEHLPCNTSSGYGGLSCGGECVSFGDWCVKGTTNPTVCGYHLQNPVICRNKTFWEKQECPETSKGRCTGWWPGQCQGEDGCRDKSHQDNSSNNNNSSKNNTDNSTCLAGEKIMNITEEFMTCPDKYNSSLLICAKKCDRVFDGCRDDSDEKDCKPVVSNMILGLTVGLLILVTIISAELTIWILTMKKLEKGPENELVNGESTEMKTLIKEDKEKQKEKIHKWVWFGKQSSLKDNEKLQEIAGHMDKLFDMILDPNNWKFGELQFATCSTFAAPVWTSVDPDTGQRFGFDNQKMDALQLLYNNFRKLIQDVKDDQRCQAFNIRKCDCPRCMCFRFFLYAIPNKSPENPRKTFEKVPHYVFDLIYKRLEVKFLKEHVSNTEDIDISIKYAMGNRESGVFYGNVFPYLDVLNLLKELLPINEAWIETIKTFIRNIPYIQYIIYYIGIILAIVGFYVDFIKDVLIADHVSFLYTTFWDFKSQIVLLLWATIFVNQTIIGIMIVIRDPTKLFNVRVRTAWKVWLIRFIFLILSPLSPSLLLYMNKRMGLKIEGIEKRLEKELEIFHPPKISTIDNLKLYHAREQLIKQKRKLESMLGTSYIIGVIYENTPQILVQVLIVLLSLSAMTLPGLTGVEAVWDTRNGSDNIGSLFFFFSMIWSLFSIITSLVSTFLYRKENSIGDLGKILIFFQMLISTSLRLICTILYFAPFLGLFNILLHYQIEQTISYSQEINYQPHKLDWYLLMTRNEAVIVFFFLPFLHAMIVLIYKSIFLEDFNLEKMAELSSTIATRLSNKHEDQPNLAEHQDQPKPAEHFVHNCLIVNYNRCLHAFSSLLGPTIWRDWDIPIKSTREDYQKLWRKARQEYLHMSVLFFVENLILLIPILYTSTRVLQHHASLEYPLQEEQVVVNSCNWFLASPVIVLVLSCLHFFLFIVYNKKGHPWSILLTQNTQEDGSLKEVDTSLIVK